MADKTNAMKEITEKSIADLLTEDNLTPQGETGLSKYQERVVTKGEPRYNVQVLVKYLAACKHHIVVEDLLGYRYRIKELKDFDDVIYALLERYHRTLFDIKKSGTAYKMGCSESRAFSVATLIDILKFFKCKLDIEQDDERKDYKTKLRLGGA